MGAFSDYARKFWEAGYQPVPIEPESKICRIKNSNKIFFEEFLTESELEKWIESHGSWEIGIALGKVSGVIAVDFDYEGYEDSETVENIVLGAIPPSTVVKKGKKGWTRFYKYSDGVGIKHFKRGDTSALDILSTGSYTVIPPSKHSQDIRYKWIGPDSLENLDSDDLETFELHHLKILQELLEIDTNEDNETISSIKNSTRHGKIFGYVMKESDNSFSFGELIQKTLDFDKQVNKNHEKGPYFEDPKYKKQDSPKKACEKLLQRIIKWKKDKKYEKGIYWEIGKNSSSYWRKDSKGNWQSSKKFEDFAEFFNLMFPDARLCPFTDTVFFYKRGKWRPVENQIKVLESYALEVGLSHTFVEKHLYRWISNFRPKLLIDISKHDGKDYIEEAIDYLSFKNIRHDYAKELLKEWFAKIFQRIYYPSVHNHFVILKGGQGIGKDTWINTVLSGFGPYYDEVAIQQDKIENYRTLSALAVGFIPEFDETDRVAVNVLKSIISAQSATFRAPYQKKAENKKFRYSLISSTNYDHLLRDSSGNRRFMIFELENINWGYSKVVSPEGILSQAKNLFLNGYKASETARNQMNQFISDETPLSSNDLFLEEAKPIIEQRIKNIDALKYDGSSINSTFYQYHQKNKWRLRWDGMSDDLMRIGRKYGFSVRRIQSILKKAGLTRRDNIGTYFTT